MAVKNNRNANSLESILTFGHRDAPSEWSVVWSTTHVPGMDNAMGGGARRRVAGRRRLQLGALALGTLLTMHCRVAASAITGGFFVFMLFLMVAVALLANPLRHFEVYLGQWSISGPGRAFRIIPMLDGIGIAICINAILRAINCCTVAAIAALYLIHSVSDAKLPFTYCRDFELRPYEPIMKDVKKLMHEVNMIDDEDLDEETTMSTTVGMYHMAWRNVTKYSNFNDTKQPSRLRRIQTCKEKYEGNYPPLYRTPAYNFFYVEVIHLRPDYSFEQFNMPLVLSITVAWLIVWIFMVIERISHGRLIWNNVYPWFMGVPCAWATLLMLAASSHVSALRKTFRKVFRIGAKEVLIGMSDALEVALYIHSASVGTETIHGKGLNHYASGHIDPYLNSENVWHSGLLLALTVLHSAGAAICALVDYIQPNTKHAVYDMHESTLWIIPMYSKCALVGNYSHCVSTLLFGGLMFSYITVAFVLLKTALHTIFEYRVKLVFVEQVVVAVLILSCMSVSMLYATSGGIALLESVDAVMTGVCVPFICLLELVGLLYVYRSRDFVSDVNVATEENACASRIGAQWQIIPFITFVMLLVKVITMVNAEMPPQTMVMALAPLVAVVASVPLRACHNAYVFLRPEPRRAN